MTVLMKIRELQRESKQDPWKIEEKGEGGGGGRGGEGGLSDWPSSTKIERDRHSWYVETYQR